MDPQPNAPFQAPRPPAFDARLQDRVRRHTASYVNEAIDRRSHAAVESSVHGGRDAIVARLQALDREWDIDRALMANFAVAGTVAHELGHRVHRAFNYVFRAQMAFLAMHAVVGWCPPVAVFRRLGFRTAKEIAAERTELLERLKSVPR